MMKKRLILPAVTAIYFLPLYGIANAEDQTYYGFGDKSNTGDISGVNWILDKDYLFYGGHQSFYAAYTKSGIVSNNTMTINGGTYTVGGESAFSSNKYANYFYCGVTQSNGSAVGNRIIINNGSFINESGTWQAAGIYAAQATEDGCVAANNDVTINNGDFRGYTYISPGLGYIGSDSVSNTVTINGGTFEKGIYIFGGRAYSTGNTDNNTVNVTGGNIGGYRAFIWGGKADNGDARYNIVNLTGGAVASMPSDESIYESKFVEYEQGDAEFYGGYTLTGNALYNTVNISGGSISTQGLGMVYGGYSRTGNANYNTLNISGGSISSKMTIIGGFATAGNAIGNILNLKGGSGNGNVYLSGGITGSNTGNATDNKIAIYFPARLKEVCGGAYITGSDDDGFIYNITNNGDLRTGNELYLASSGIAARSIWNFETLKFYLPSSYTQDKTMLTLTGAGTSDLTNTNFVLEAAGGTSLAKGQTINLISSQGKINYGKQTGGTLKQGVSLNYNYTLSKDSQNLQAILGDAQLTAETKSFVETRAAQASFLNRGADLLTAEGFLQAEKATEGEKISGEWLPFFAMQGGKYRYKTGSHIDSRGFGGILGIARKNENLSGNLLYGLAVEYGKGNYDSYCNNVHGEGDSDYTGAVIFLRHKNNAGMYYEGSIRGGKTKADYTSGNFTGYESVSYNTDGKYFGAHLGIGKNINLAEKNDLNLSLKYFYSQTGKDSARLSTGETYDFSAVKSHRLRLGAELNHSFNENSKGYVGAYYEREFNGDARATVAGYGTAAPSLKGNRGIFEIGLIHQPKNSNFKLNLGIVASCGTQKGITGNVGMIWKL